VTPLDGLSQHHKILTIHPGGILLFPICIALLFFLLTAAPASAQFDKVLKGLGSLSGGSGLSDAEIGFGLQEALKVGTENAVVQTGGGPVLEKSSD
jgi:hypothetical protein